MNNTRVWVHPFFKKRNKSGEYHHLLHSLRKHPNKLSWYLRMSVDSFDYILSKVRSTAHHPRWKTKEKRNPPLANASCKKVVLFLVLPLQFERPASPNCCLCVLMCFRVSGSPAAGRPAPVYVWLYQDGYNTFFFHADVYFCLEMTLNTSASKVIACFRPFQDHARCTLQVWGLTKVWDPPMSSSSS